MTRTKINKEEAERRIDEFLKRHDMYSEEKRQTANAMLTGFGGLYFRFIDGLWATEADTDVKAWQRIENEADKTFTTWTFSVQISWSSTHRDVSQAVSALNNYNKAVTWAAMIESFLKELPDIREEIVRG